MEKRIRKEKLTNYSYIHQWNNENHQKSGRCIECNRENIKTEWALIHGREHARGIENYRELCQRCHRKYDHIGRNAWNKGNVAVYPKICEFCLKCFNGVKKSRRFCSNSCSSKAKAGKLLMKRPTDPITGRWLALNSKK